MTKKNQDQDAELASQLAVDNSLETVRDILFGAQVKESRQRTAELEELVKATANDLQKGFDQQFHKLENALQKMQENLARQARAMAAEIAERFQFVDETIGKLESSSKAARSDLYEELSAEREALEKRAAGWNEDLARQLDTVQQQLQHSKTDRSSLAQLLQSMAVSLLEDEPQAQPGNPS